MHKDRAAVISIGTNSTRMLLVDFSAKRFGFFGDPATRIIRQKSVGTRIGEGLQESGHLGEEPMQRTLDVVQSHYDALVGMNCSISVIATSALRRADNADDFIGRVHDITGMGLEILDGEMEARASFRGAVTSLDDMADARVGVLDTGGGSTEYAAGSNEHADQTISCEIGAVRLTEWYAPLAGHDGMVDNQTIDDARARAHEILKPLSGFPRVEAVAFVGGSATTALSVVRGHRGPYGDMILTREKLHTAFNVLCELPVEKRRTEPGMNPQRADILPAGMLILDVALEKLGHTEATVSFTDLLFGYLLLQREKQFALTP